MIRKNKFQVNNQLRLISVKNILFFNKKNINKVLKYKISILYRK